MNDEQLDRLRKGVAWAEAEHAKDTKGIPAGDGTSIFGDWRQGTWLTGKVGARKRTIESISYGDGETALRAPTEYLQINVKCGANMCLAGNVVAEEGDAFVVSQEIYGPGETADVDYVIPKGSRTAMHVETRARELLGITYEEGNQLFDGDTDIELLRERAAEVALNYGHTL
jgi:hypothetical protein